MIFDAHIHQYYECPDDPAVFLEQAQKSGIGGGNIYKLANTISNKLKNIYN